MSLDRIITYVDLWSTAFGRLIEYLTMPISDFLPNWIGNALPDAVAQYTLFSFVFDSIMLIIGIIIVKWFVDIIL